VRDDGLEYRSVEEKKKRGGLGRENEC